MKFRPAFCPSAVNAESDVTITNMFLLLRPTDQQIRDLLEYQRTQCFSYGELGATRGQLPSGYRICRKRAELGRGLAQFERAVDAMRQWKIFSFPGVWLCWSDKLIRSGEVVGVLMKHFGFYSLNFCRIVYVIEEDGPVRRFGFAYGTLKEHAERGEESFTVEWDRATDVVMYKIVSFSRPGNWKTRIGYPLATRLQDNFARRSVDAMARAVQSGLMRHT